MEEVTIQLKKAELQTVLQALQAYNRSLGIEAARAMSVGKKRELHQLQTELPPVIGKIAAQAQEK